ncbi:MULTISPECIES: hypothetical protein [Kitasatospora]|uniref:PE-PGRS family protein n=1 Tax=Kitasatospora setae (strain ATCC 33774 / DSM 43861 / JCM 3304 / KCC A-0304 / NBRC 14216 / KM-6054) TaxID=452652 RepID=E4NIJ3_KITSK|nr:MULTISPECIES: hypothetical protein [Kitasatospora]BAJ32791.1 hypothetical protein KSE_70330 [Kitasatospora setae KM-6054]
MTNDPNPSEPGAPVFLAGPLLREQQDPTALRRPGPGVSQVHFYRNGGHSIVTARGDEHVNRPLLGRAMTVSEVARGTYVTSLSLQVPAVGGTTFFDVEVDVHWTVTDCLRVVETQLTDLAVRLKAPLVHLLRGICENHRVSDAADAERKAMSACASGQWDYLGDDLGLDVRLYVRFAVDRATLEHAGRLRDGSNQGDLAAQEHQGKLAEEYRKSQLLALQMGKFERILDGGEQTERTYILAADPDGAAAYLAGLHRQQHADRQERLTSAVELMRDGAIQSVELENRLGDMLSADGHPAAGALGRPPVRSGHRPAELTSAPHRDDTPDDRDRGTDRPGRNRETPQPYTPTWLDVAPDADRPRRRPSEAFDDWESAAPPDDRPERTDRARDRERERERERDRERERERERERDDWPDDQDDHDDRAWSPDRGR